MRFEDADVEPGIAYEYRVESAEPLPRLENRRASGVLAAGIDLPVVDSRGSALLLVDRTLAAPLAGELARLAEDLCGDGWAVLRRDVERQGTVCAPATAAEVAAVKEVIREAWHRERGKLRAVLLIGRVPIPYSGWLIPEAHDFEPREADTYYALPEHTWTDARTYGDGKPKKGIRGNVAGDGTFDQSWFDPTAVRLAVGRIDMSGLPIFGLPEPELVRRYLNKHHAFRQRITAFAPACDTGSGLVGSRTGFYLESLFDRGMVNPVHGQLAGELDAPRLWSYAEGLASINNELGRLFSTRDPQYVFMGCWGSGINFDIEAGKQGMGRPCLAGKGACLTWVCGQPNRFFHWMALGETIGDCERLAMVTPRPTHDRGRTGRLRHRVAGGSRDGRTAVDRARPVPIKACLAPGYTFDRWAIAERSPRIADPRAAETTIALDSPAGIRAVYRRLADGDALQPRTAGPP